MGDSNLWRGISSVWNDLSKNQGWIINKGNLARIWIDDWRGDGSRLMKSTTLNLTEDMMIEKVADYGDDQGGWNWQKINAIVPDALVRNIYAISPPNLLAGDDELYWAASGNGMFSIKSAYWILASNCWVNRDSTW